MSYFGVAKGGNDIHFRTLAKILKKFDTAQHGNFNIFNSRNLWDWMKQHLRSRVAFVVVKIHED